MRSHACKSVPPSRPGAAERAATERVGRDVANEWKRKFAAIPADDVPSSGATLKKTDGGAVYVDVIDPGPYLDALGTHAQRRSAVQPFWKIAHSEHQLVTHVVGPLMDSIWISLPAQPPSVVSVTMFDKRVVLIRVDELAYARMDSCIRTPVHVPGHVPYDTIERALVNAGLNRCFIDFTCLPLDELRAPILQTDIVEVDDVYYGLFRCNETSRSALVVLDAEDAPSDDGAEDAPSDDGSTTAVRRVEAKMAALVNGAKGFVRHPSLESVEHVTNFTPPLSDPRLSAFLGLDPRRSHVIIGET